MRLYGPGLLLGTQDYLDCFEKYCKIVDLWKPFDGLYFQDYGLSSTLSHLFTCALLGVRQRRLDSILPVPIFTELSFLPFYLFLLG